ncbi:hypothetical protein RvY_19054-2 [Ramazzottius varieornatus]|uniref:Uncharacterized protein n=1 Tax=Ramazzottius varieornatus TaxID=947166 RepID=A0A1D1W876_RAMVA|nr:hypothetical protein RvY_19054-2 [Ramazzottius varieornatus]
MHFGMLPNSVSDFGYHLGTSSFTFRSPDHVSVFAYCEKHQKTKKKIARSRRNFEAEQSAFRPAKGSQDSALGNGPALSVNCVCCHPCDDHGLLHCEACSTRQPGDGRPGEPSLRNSVYSKENDDVARLSMDRSIFYTECLLGKCSHCWIPGSTYTFYLRGQIPVIHNASSFSTYLNLQERDQSTSGNKKQFTTRSRS